MSSKIYSGMQPAEIQKAQYKILQSLSESPNGTIPDIVKQEIVQTDKALNFCRPVEYQDTPEDKAAKAEVIAKAEEYNKNPDIKQKQDIQAFKALKALKTPFFSPMTNRINNLISSKTMSEEIQKEIDQKMMKQLMDYTDSYNNPVKFPQIQPQFPMRPYTEEEIVKQNLGEKITTDDLQKSREWLEQVYKEKFGSLPPRSDPVGFNYLAMYQNGISQAKKELDKPRQPMVQSENQPKKEPDVDPVTGRVKRKFDLD